MKLFRFSCVLIALVLLSASAPDKTTTIFIIGDSTAANKDLSKGKLNLKNMITGEQQLVTIEELIASIK